MLTGILAIAGFLALLYLCFFLLVTIVPLIFKLTVGILSVVAIVLCLGIFALPFICLVLVIHALRK